MDAEAERGVGGCGMGEEIGGDVVVEVVFYNHRQCAPSWETTMILMKEKKATRGDNTYYSSRSDSSSSHIPLIIPSPVLDFPNPWDAFSPAQTPFVIPAPRPHPQLFVLEGSQPLVLCRLFCLGLLFSRRRSREDRYIGSVYALLCLGWWEDWEVGIAVGHSREVGGMRRERGPGKGG